MYFVVALLLMTAQLSMTSPLGAPRADESTATQGCSAAQQNTVAWNDTESQRTAVAQPDPAASALYAKAALAVANLRTIELRAGHSRDELPQHIWRSFGARIGAPTSFRVENAIAKTTTICDGTQAVVFDEVAKTYRDEKAATVKRPLDWCITNLRVHGLQLAASDASRSGSKSTTENNMGSNTGNNTGNNTERSADPTQSNESDATSHRAAREDSVFDGSTFEIIGDELVDGHVCTILRQRIESTTTIEFQGKLYTVPVRGVNTYAISTVDHLPRWFSQQVGSSLDRPDLDPPTKFHFSIVAINREIPEAQFQVPTTAELEAKGMSRASKAAPAKRTTPSVESKVGLAAPDFELKDLRKDFDGTVLSLTSLRGKVVVLDFWASWCGPCKRAMPFLEELHQSYATNPATRDRVVVLGMNTGESDLEAARRIGAEKKLTYRQLIDADDASLAYGVAGLPALFIIDGDGKIILHETGFGGDGYLSRLRSVIDAALRAKE